MSAAVPELPGSQRSSKTTDDLRLALRAASMYHLEGATQAHIAAKLGVSRPTAGRLIAKARALGLVSIEINVPDEVQGTVHADIEQELEKLLVGRSINSLSNEDTVQDDLSVGPMVPAYHLLMMDLVMNRFIVLVSH